MDTRKFTKRPEPDMVKITDKFWSAYLEKVRGITLPDIFDKFESHGYFLDFDIVAKHEKGPHNGPAWTDGLVYESIRGACDFLNDRYDEALDRRLDGYIERISRAAAADKDGYLCTNTIMTCPEKRWGMNDGNLIGQHDLYNAGACVEAGIAHYSALGKTSLLDVAVKMADYMCANMGEPPKMNIIPAHPLPEEAFIKLYRLFNKMPALCQRYGHNGDEYLRLSLFWIGAHGHHENRACFPHNFGEYSQDHIPFAEQTEAVGHAVRAQLFYTGVSAAVYETGNSAYMNALNHIWDDVTLSKIHISGGIGARHDIEGFDVKYNLPNNAYLETCAGVAFAFWAGEMNLITGKADCFDYFERSLYNNILASLSYDGSHYFYQNPLESDGNLERWDWHCCPCCPPMLFKIFSALKTYIYAYNDDNISVNIYIDSTFDNGAVRLNQSGGVIAVESCIKPFTLKLRMPEYTEGFAASASGKEENGYYVIENVQGGDIIRLSGSQPVRIVYADPRVKDDIGLVAFRRGPYVYCAEGTDNNGDINFTVAEKPDIKCEKEIITGNRADGGRFTLIPYCQWDNRGASAMKVWLPAENFKSKFTGNKLYCETDVQ